MDVKISKQNDGHLLTIATEYVVEFAKETYSLGVDHYDMEDYINMNMIDEPFDE